MSRYRLSKQVSLGFLGDGWEAASATFRRPTVDEVKTIDKKIKGADNYSALDTIVATVKQFFVNGTGISTEGDLIKLEVDEMPVDFFYECYTALMGGDTSPKS